MKVAALKVLKVSAATCCTLDLTQWKYAPDKVGFRQHFALRRGDFANCADCQGPFALQAKDSTDVLNPYRPVNSDRCISACSLCIMSKHVMQIKYVTPIRSACLTNGASVEKTARSFALRIFRGVRGRQDAAVIRAARRSSFQRRTSK